MKKKFIISIRCVYIYSIIKIEIKINGNIYTSEIYFYIRKS